MLKNLFKVLFNKKTSDENTRKVKDSCNYWADDENEVDYSPSFTAQDVLASTTPETVNTSDFPSKETEEDKQTTSSGGWGCGGGCL